MFEFLLKKLDWSSYSFVGILCYIYYVKFSITISNLIQPNHIYCIRCISLVFILDVYIYL